MFSANVKFYTSITFLCLFYLLLASPTAYADPPSTECSTNNKNNNDSSKGGSEGDKPNNYKPNIGWIRSDDKDQDPKQKDKPRSYQNCGGVAFLNDIASLESKIPGLHKKEKGKPGKHPLDDPKNAENFWDNKGSKKKKGYEYINRDKDHETTTESEMVDALKEYIKDKGFKADVGLEREPTWEELTKQMEDGHDLKILIHETGSAAEKYTHWVHVQSVDKEKGEITISDPNTIKGNAVTGDTYTVDKEKMEFSIKTGNGDETKTVKIESKVYVTNVALKNKKGKPTKTPEGPAMGNGGGKMSYEYELDEQSLNFAPESVTTIDLFGGGSNSIDPNFIDDPFANAFMSLSDFDYFAPTTDGRLNFVDGSMRVESGAGELLFSSDIPNLFVDNSGIDKVYGFLDNWWFNSSVMSDLFDAFTDSMNNDPTLRPMYSFRTDTDFNPFIDQFGFIESFEFDGSSFITLNTPNLVNEPRLAFLFLILAVYMILFRRARCVRYRHV